MRQRILLVAGWAAAAVVTSLVASGAVAVAGGQVADRPLRPLSASEVAALPAVLTEGGHVPCRPLASGGSERDTGSTPDSAGPTSDGGSSAGDGTSSADGEDVPTVQTQVVSVRGGSANVAAEDGALDLLWAIARPGFSVDHAVDEDGALRITFSCEGFNSVVEAWWTEHLECAFDASTSGDVEENRVVWDFGDGTTDIGATTAHAFDSKGPALVTLTLTDGRGASAIRRHLVGVSPENRNGTEPFTWACVEVAAIAIDTFEDAQ